MSKPILIEFNGKIATLKEHCESIGINYNTLKTRHQKTGESYVECLKYYQENGIKVKYRAKDRRLYIKWHSIIDRCYNSKNSHYKWYGKRGIKVYESWHNYENFENDLLESFLEHIEEYGIKDTTIDRIDYNGDYEPNNVRWATRKEQANNTSRNCILVDNLTIAQCSKKYGIPYNTIIKRLKLGWTIDEIISIPVGTKIKHFSLYLPCNVPLKQHCIANNYNYNSVGNYIYRYNLSPDQALAKYLEKRNKK